MLIVGLVSTKEEQSEIRLVAQIWILRQRIHDITNQTEGNPRRSDDHTIHQQLK